VADARKLGVQRRLQCRLDVHQQRRDRGPDLEVQRPQQRHRRCPHLRATAGKA
jgi:hypothetical protein